MANVLAFIIDLKSQDANLEKRRILREVSPIAVRRCAGLFYPIHSYIVCYMLI